MYHQDTDRPQRQSFVLCLVMVSILYRGFLPSWCSKHFDTASRSPVAQLLFGWKPTPGPTWGSASCPKGTSAHNTGIKPTMLWLLGDCWAIVGPVGLRSQKQVPLSWVLLWFSNSRPQAVAGWLVEDSKLLFTTENVFSDSVLIKTVF